MKTKELPILTTMVVSSCRHLLPVEICVAKNTYNCMPHVRKNIEGTYRDLRTIAKGLCTSRPRTEASSEGIKDHCLSDMLMGRSTVCSVPDALYCMNTLHARILQAKDKDSVCR